MGYDHSLLLKFAADKRTLAKIAGPMHKFAADKRGVADTRRITDLTPRHHGNETVWRARLVGPPGQIRTLTGHPYGCYSGGFGRDSR